MVARAPFALTPCLLLARILLCATFLPIGIQKLRTVEFTGNDAVRINEMLETDKAAPKVTDTGTSTASLGGQTDDDVEGTSVHAKALYKTALLVEDAGWGSPVLLAWITTLLEMVGSLLLLIGLLTRVWALGLCVVMGAAFTLTSLPLISVSTWALFELPLEAYNRFAAQAGLFGLSAVVLTCGAGRISIDKLLFGHRSHSHHIDHADHDDEGE